MDLAEFEALAEPLRQRAAAVRAQHGSTLTKNQIATADEFTAIELPLPREWTAHVLEPWRETGQVHKLIRNAAAQFLRGEISVVGFTYAFRDAMAVVTRDRSLTGHEVLIFHALEEWENSGWPGRPAIVDRLRELVASADGPSGGQPLP